MPMVDSPACDSPGNTRTQTAAKQPDLEGRLADDGPVGEFNSPSGNLAGHRFCFCTHAVSPLPYLARHAGLPDQGRMRHFTLTHP